MAAAILGSTIALFCTSALSLAIDSIEKIYRNSGRYPLQKSEIEIMKSSGVYSEDNRDLLNEEFESYPQKYE